MTRAPGRPRFAAETDDGVNPTGIVPKGPELDLSQPHDRG